MTVKTTSVVQYVCPLSLAFEYTLERILILTNRRHIISSCPEVLTNKILLSSLKIPSDLNRAFAFDKTNNLRHRMFGWDGDQNVNMIGHQMPFNHLAFFLRCQMSKDLSQVFPEVFKDSLFTILRNSYNAILAFPLRVAKALSFVHEKSPFLEL